jgi:hypothetical protein
MADRELKDDWETEALRRVADRVESLTARPAANVAVDADGTLDDAFGWEESVLRRLRARLFTGDLSD